MKIGINAWVWDSPITTERLAELAPKAAQMGFDHIEVPIEATSDLDYEEGARIIQDEGLGVSVVAAMGPDRDLIHPDESIRDNGMDYLRHCIDAAQTLGAPNLVGPLYSAVGRTWQATDEEREADLKLLVRQLKELAAYAEEREVMLCVEPLNRFETSFINLAEQAIDVVDRVDSPACGIMLDTFHMNIEERSLGDAIRAAGERLQHVHACENDRGAPGSGHVPWEEVFEALQDIGYDGPLVIETFTSKVETIARAAAIWRPLASSQDALAEEGLSFLRSMASQPA